LTRNRPRSAIATAASAPGRPASWAGGSSRRACLGHRLLQSQYPRPGLPRRRRRPLRLDTHNDIFEDMKDELLPALRSRLLGPARRPARTRLAEGNARRVHGRVRPGAAGGDREDRGARLARPASTGPPVLGVAGRRRHHAGAVFGKSDKHAAYVLDEPVSPATSRPRCSTRWGFSADTHFTDLTNRPSRIVSGHPVTKLFS